MANPGTNAALGMRRMRNVAAALGMTMVALAGPAIGQTSLSLGLTAYKQAVAETMADQDGIAAFYRSRNFAPFWTAKDDAGRDRRAALLEAFAMADAHGLPAGAYDARVWMSRLAAARSERDLGQLEVALSGVFLDFAHDLQSGVIEPDKVVDGIKRKAPRRDAAGLLARLAEEDPRAVFRSLPPSSQEYARLMRTRMELARLIARGGWGPTVQARRLEPGDAGPQTVRLRDRLVAMGFLAPTLTMRYDSRMQDAVTRFQLAHGLEADGIAGSATIDALNVPARERLRAVAVAMERERWLNLEGGLGQRHIKVNLTDFHAEIVDDGKLTFATRSVIGHQDLDRRTPEFSDEMDHMVINPSWYVPRSIIVGEYLPNLRRNPYAHSYLEITDNRGRVVNRGQGFAQYSAASFPFAMRQPPGPRNALGTVKFMFPNRYNIYLHDTPAKSLFSREVRTYSHGCVRLNDPHEFGYTLLARQETDPVGYFNRILRSGSETRVNLEQPVPVHLIYRTAYTQAKGPVHYRRDVYGRDARIWDALSAEGVALTRRGS